MKPPYATATAHQARHVYRLAHHRAGEALDDYLEAAGPGEAKAPLFQSLDPAGRRLTGRALSRRLVLAMIKRRAADLPASTCCHTFRATGITVSAMSTIGARSTPCAADLLRLEPRGRAGVDGDARGFHDPVARIPPEVDMTTDAYPGSAGERAGLLARVGRVFSFDTTVYEEVAAAPATLFRRCSWLRSPGRSAAAS